MNAIELRGVTGRRGAVPTVRALDLHVEPGEVVALVGANGAGKSTTIRCISGIDRVSSGAVSLLGRDVTGASPRTRARMGLATVLESRGIFTQLTVAENLAVAGARRHGVVGEWFPVLVPLLRRRAGLLSGGEQTMLALARALAGRPQALVVDELSTGLAPAAAAEALGLLRRVAADRGIGVLIAEQSTDLALSAADRAYVLRQGEVSAEGSARALREEPARLALASLGDVEQGSASSETNP
jgi:branched-chain amino acid transport system ATP-binding protein